MCHCGGGRGASGPEPRTQPLRDTQAPHQSVVDPEGVVILEISSDLCRHILLPQLIY